MRVYSIKTKLTLFAAAIVLSMAALLLLSSLFLAEPVMIRGQKRELMELYHSLGADFSSAELSDFFAGYERKHNFQVELFDEQGRLLYTSGRKMEEGFEGFPGGRQPQFQQPEQRLFAEDYSDSPSVERRTLGDLELLSLKGVLRGSDGSLRYLSIETPVEAISQTAKIFRSMILAICLIAALLGCLAAISFGRRFSQPMVRLADTARRVAALDFSCPAEEQSSTAEIGALAKSINIMRDRLADFIRQLMEKNRRLEEDNKRLQQEEEMRRSFIANVSHDLKSPLAVLSGYAEMLKEHTEGVEPEECYDVILEETATMNEMIRSMLEVSAIENGLKDLKVMEVEGAILLRELLGRVQPLMEKKGFRLSASFSEGVRLMADPELLSRALMNILQNALSHTKEAGEIRVSLIREGSQAVFSVYNDGEPIPPEKQDKIWQSFYRTDEARTRGDTANVGLGLYIVRSVAVAHGGSCSVHNEEQGVIFRIFLPAL